MEVDLIKKAGYPASKFRLKIIESENIKDYQNFVKVNEIIEVIVYHKNTAVISSISEIKRGDIIRAIVSMTGDERRYYWQARDIKIIKRANFVEKEKLMAENQERVLYIAAGIALSLILGIVFWRLRR